MKKITNYNTLFTVWGENFDEKAWDVYPRPQLKRNSFLSLNGKWDFAVSESPHFFGFKEKITVPFVPQSVLSGVFKTVPCEYYLIYQRKFSLPKGFLKDRLILHFGAVDQTAQVLLNGKEVGNHVGGYESFCFDITDYLQDENTLTVICKDDLKSKILPYGKQREKRGGMWYTPVSGIWQTVWLESVPENYIKSIKIDCDDKRALVTVNGVSDGLLTVYCDDGEKDFSIVASRTKIELPRHKLWSPENPNIYRFKIRSGDDTVESYLAFRKIEIKEINGIKRICLNGKPYFFHALLDQGYFSDGIFTPASPECMKQDIMTAKSLGFNTLRKHIKVELELFYYYCDILGMAVFQDMVNNSDYNFLRDTALPTVGIKRLPDKFMHNNTESRRAFFYGMKSTVATLYNHPCVLYWTIFNEAWGQFQSDLMYKNLKQLDSSRIIDSTSGWFSQRLSDVESPHIYFKRVKIKKGKNAVVLSEFGGYSYKPEGHVFNTENTYGYKLFDSKEDFMDSLEKLYYDEIVPAIKNGLCGAVYTQLSDVEDETNGLLSYDRKILKVDKLRMLKIAEKLRTAFDSLSLDKNQD